MCIIAWGINQIVRKGFKGLKTKGVLLEMCMVVGITSIMSMTANPSACIGLACTLLYLVANADKGINLAEKFVLLIGLSSLGLKIMSKG